jgi:hypothetical protein
MYLRISTKRNVVLTSAGTYLGGSSSEFGPKYRYLGVFDIDVYAEPRLKEFGGF